MNASIRYRLSLFLMLLAMTCLVLHGHTAPAKTKKTPPKAVKKAAIKTASKSSADSSDKAASAEGAKTEAKPTVAKEAKVAAKEAPGEETPADPNTDPDEAQYTIEEKDPTGDHYTSVIVDASDFHVTRSMSPKICREDGSKAWPCLSYIDPEYVLSYGIVVYARSLDEAKSLKRAGKNPLVVRATRHGQSADDPVLNDVDVDNILAANKRNKCLDKFKVIFILDKRVSPIN